MNYKLDFSIYRYRTNTIFNIKMMIIFKIPSMFIMPVGLLSFENWNFPIGLTPDWITHHWCILYSTMDDL